MGRENRPWVRWLNKNYPSLFRLSTGRDIYPRSTISTPGNVTCNNHKTDKTVLNLSLSLEKK